jgi:hypothetical protein
MGVFVAVMTPAINLLIFHRPSTGPFGQNWLDGISYATGYIVSGIGLALLGRHARKRHRKEPEEPGG